MKKLKAFAFSALAALVFTGCNNDNPVASETVISEVENNTKVVNDSGTITISLPSINVSRAFDLSTAKSMTNIYEVVVYNDSINTSLVIDDTTSTALLTVPAGNFNILVLAGHTNNANYKYDTKLLGSGVANNIAVTANKVTEVDITLKNALLSVTYPDTVQCGSKFTVQATLDLGHQSIRHIYPTADISGQSYENPNTPLYDSTNTNVPMTFEITSQLTPGTDTLTMFNFGLISFYPETKLEWELYNTADPFDPYYNDLNFPIEFISAYADPTGINVNIEWIAG